MTEQERKRLLDFLADPELDEEREILEAPPVPLSPALESRLVEAALREAAPAAAAGPAEIPAMPKRADSASAPDELAARRSRRQRFIPWIGGLAAVAAATVLVLRGTPSTEEIPPYTIEAHGRTRLLSQDSDSSAGDAHLAPGARLDLLIRPKRPAPADTVVQSYLRQGDTHLRWNIHPERTGANGFYVNLPFAQIPDLRPGRQRAVFIIGRKDHMPSETDIARLIRDEAATRPGVQIVRQWLVVEGP